MGSSKSLESAQEENFGLGTYQDQLTNIKSTPQPVNTADQWL